jgi:hypothetical protein
VAVPDKCQRPTEFGWDSIQRHGLTTDGQIFIYLQQISCQFLPYFISMFSRGDFDVCFSFIYLRGMLGFLRGRNSKLDNASVQIHNPGRKLLVGLRTRPKHTCAWAEDRACHVTCRRAHGHISPVPTRIRRVSLGSRARTVPSSLAGISAGRLRVAVGHGTVHAGERAYK